MPEKRLERARQTLSREYQFGGEGPRVTKSRSGEIVVDFWRGGRWYTVTLPPEAFEMRLGHSARCVVTRSA